MNILNERSNSQINVCPLITVRSSSLNNYAVPQQRKRNETLIKSLLDKSENSIFPKVLVLIDSKQKEYSPIYNWFDFNKKFDDHPKKTRIVFTCYVCGAKKHELSG
jgi:hypothetical protein